MHDRLDRTARRILGTLAEKQLSTPHLYPLTLNALVNGCNQKNAREPVLQLQEFEVEGSLKQLFLEHWVTNSAGGGARTIKWKHRLDDRLALDRESLAVMTELLLRGAQSPGALRAHVARLLDPEPDLERLAAILADLEAKGLVRDCPPARGERSRRIDHLLYPEDEAPIHDEEGPPTGPGPSRPAGSPGDRDLLDRITELEARLERIERELGLGGSETRD
ncbi:MAG: DUF480 domain-containing protein [Planctomycetes bacterium]|nr:DUF480 domain-containing protein [Planctomycetota bacterium]